MSEITSINPNTADEETLAQIPGVGEELAKRIINARPFASLDDLRRVNGIGSTMLDRISPFLEFSSSIAEPAGEESGAVMEITETETIPEVEEPSEEPMASEIAELSMDDRILSPEEEALPGNENLPEGAQSLYLMEQPGDEATRSSEKTPPEGVPLERPGPTLATRSQLYWVSCGSAFLAFVFAVALILGVLVSINGSLRFASPAQVHEISSEMDALSGQTDSLTRDMNGLRARLDNLEGLSGRIEMVETTTRQLESDVKKVSTQIESLSQKVADFETQVNTLKEQNARFQEFFDSLRSLLENLFPGEVTQ